MRAALCILCCLWAGPALAGGEVLGPFSYQCEDGGRFTAVFDNPAGTVVLAFPDGATLTLPRVLAASGIRYADAGHEFWGKGDTARWSVDGRAPLTCRTRD